MERPGHYGRPLIALFLLASVLFGAAHPSVHAEDESVAPAEAADTTAPDGEPEPSDVPSPEISPGPDPLEQEPMPGTSDRDEAETFSMFSASTSETPAPSVKSFYLSWSQPRWTDGWADQTAFKPGDEYFGFVFEVWSSLEIVEAWFDLMSIGYDEPVPVRLNDYQRGFIAVEPNYDEGVVLRVGDVEDGPKTISATARDTEGREVTGHFEVQIDSVPPSMTFSSVTKSSPEETLSGDSVLEVTGMLDGTGTDTLLADIKQNEYAADGTLLRSFSILFVHENILAINNFGAGPFSLPIKLYSQDGTGFFHPEAVSVSVVFTPVDEAGNASDNETPRIPIGAEVLPPEPQVSNVLFLPGIKGSRLYSDSKGKLWIPGGDGDVRDLFLDVFGKSVRDDVHVRAGDILATVEIPFAPLRIYQSFVDEMEALKAAGTLSDWRAVPYDWRLSLTDVVNGGVERDGKIYYTETTSSPYIEETLRSLAASSKTGKVTIVAHSNGGLVAKALMQKLGDAETAALVDEVVFIGVPQLGAPQALAAILYGYDENLPKHFPLLASASASRYLAKNSPMTYHLLPSNSYFSSVSAEDREIVRFKGTRAYDMELGAYGETVDSWDEVSDFVQAADGGRGEPAEEDLKHAAIGNPALLDYAEDIHNNIDTWVPPPGVQVHQIAGWGIETFVGLELREFSLPWFGVVQEDYLPIFKKIGDEVVTNESAVSIPSSSDIHRYWISLGEVNDRTSNRYSHADLLEIDSVLELVTSILSSEGDELALSLNVYESEPVLNDNDQGFLRFFLHSPLTIEVLDKEGRRVGINEDGTVEIGIEDGEYATFGDVHYITVPAGDEYEVRLNGYDDGFFSLDVQEIQGGEVSQQATFAGLPATSETTARLVINGTINQQTILSVDIDGDSIDDAVLVADTSSEIIYTPAEQGEERESDTTIRSGRRAENNASGEPVSKPDITPAVPDSAIEIQLPGSDVPLFITEEVRGEVLGALDSWKEQDTESTAVDNNTEHNWLSSALAWAYTFIVNILKTIASIFAYAH